MTHYYQFFLWLLRRIWRGLITYPNDFLKFYKQALRDETVITLVFSVGSWLIGLSLVAYLVSERVDGKLTTSQIGGGIFLFVLFFPPAFFVITLFSMLHDQYCAELQGTVDRLKR